MIVDNKLSSQQSAGYEGGGAAPRWTVLAVLHPEDHHGGALPVSGPIKYSGEPRGEPDEVQVGGVVSHHVQREGPENSAVVEHDRSVAGAGARGERRLGQSSADAGHGRAAAAVRARGDVLESRGGGEEVVAGRRAGGRIVSGRFF